MNTVKEHLRKFPHARTSTVHQKMKEEETTRRLMREVLEEQKRRTPLPWWKRIWRAL